MSVKNGSQVLLASRDPDVMALLESAFEEAGVTLYRASSIAEMRAALSRPSLCLAVVDLYPSRAKGLWLVQALRASSVTRSVPIITLTDELEPERDVLLSFEAGADRYVARPFDAPVVLAGARALWERRELRGAHIESRPITRSSTPADFGPPPTGEHPIVPDTGMHARPGAATVEMASYVESLRLTRRSEQITHGANPSREAIPIHRIRPGETADFYSSEWALFRVLYAGLERSIQSGQPLALLMMEMTSRPELSADQLQDFLPRFSQRLGRALGRVHHTLIPFQGRTACAILSDCNEPAAIAAAKRLVETVEANPIRRSGVPIQTTLRVGVTVLEPPFTDSPFKLIDGACRALERAQSANGTHFWVYHEEHEIEDGAA